MKGYENSVDKWQNLNNSSHNEYCGALSPTSNETDGCASCHSSIPTVGLVVKPASQTISGFCATCHGNFRLLTDIGADIVSPFVRHPTDIVISNHGPSSEYAGYTEYNVNAPVGRVAVSSSASRTVTPTTDTVSCLSCHVAHASEFPDLLRWNYNNMICETNDPQQKDTGCFVCHTTKDGA